MLFEYFLKFALSNAGHGAVVAILGPATLLALWTMGVHRAFRDGHLSCNQVADAMLPVGPLHLSASMAWNFAFLQARQGSFSPLAH